MADITPTGGPSGVSFEHREVRITCTEAVAVGQVVRLTLSSGGYSACTLADTADGDGTPDRIIGVALEAVTAGADGRIALKGILEVKCHTDLDAGEIGVVSDTAGQLTAAPTNPADSGTAYIKPVAIALENTATTGDLTSCLFDGISGFAMANN